MRFTIPDMSCGGCLKAITRVVQAEDGAAKVDADLTTKDVRIETAVPEAVLRAKLTEAGYPPV